MRDHFKYMQVELFGSTLESTTRPSIFDHVFKVKYRTSNWSAFCHLGSTVFGVKGGFFIYELARTWLLFFLADVISACGATFDCLPGVFQHTFSAERMPAFAKSYRIVEVLHTNETAAPFITREGSATRIHCEWAKLEKSGWLPSSARCSYLIHCSYESCIYLCRVKL